MSAAAGNSSTRSSTGFSPGAEVVVRQLDDTNWAVTKAFSYTGKVETFDIVVGQQTDFASVPRVFVWFLPRYGRYTKAAIVHDYLWRERAGQGQMTYVDADGTFRRAMRELGVPFAKRWIMWGAVRWGALFKAGGRTGWARESWRVILVTILAAPIVLPAAVVVGITLVVFYLIELVLWIALRLAVRVKRALGRASDKEVNRPALTWKL